MRYHLLGVEPNVDIDDVRHVFSFLPPVMLSLVVLKFLLARPRACLSKQRVEFPLPFGNRHQPINMGQGVVDARSKNFVQSRLDLLVGKFGKVRLQQFEAGQSLVCLSKRNQPLFCQKPEISSLERPVMNIKDLPSVASLSGKAGQMDPRANLQVA